jgi:hypothetical protein
MEVPADELRWYLRMLVDEASRRRAAKHAKAWLRFLAVSRSMLGWPCVVAC